MSRTPAHIDVEFVRFGHLPGVELRRSCYRESVFRTHTHPTWSVGMIESGETSFTLSGHSYHGEAGQIVVIDPGMAHACNPTPGRSITHSMFYLSREWLAPKNPDQGFPTFPVPVIDDARLFEQWHGLYERFTSKPDAADAAALESAIGALVDAHAQPSAYAVSDQGEGVSRAKRLLQERLDERVTLTQLAQTASMSRSHLSRAFSATEGLPPHTYHNQLRVERAKELLASGKPLAQVAMVAGFTDQSHFTRVFREFTGATPSQYQAAGSSAM